MEHWLFLFAAATALFVAGFVLKAAIGLALRYVLFFVLAMVVTAQRQGGEIWYWLDAGTLTHLAVSAALALAITSALLLAFRKSRFRPLLLPVFALGATLVLSPGALPG